MSYIIVGRKKLQSTPSVGRATGGWGPWGGDLPISIHALRGEGDLLAGVLAVVDDISIHALRGEGDVFLLGLQVQPLQFLSTPSVGRATIIRHSGHDFVVFLSTPSVGRATPQAAPAAPATVEFLSTPSVGRATLTGMPAAWPSGHFYPRPPWGGRPSAFLAAATTGKFLSTPSVGRATHNVGRQGPGIDISIHALRGEGDTMPTTPATRSPDFYPRPPWGGRLLTGRGDARVRVWVSRAE